MESAFPRRPLQIGVNLLFLYLGLVTFAMGVLMTRRSRNWIISDWLINYEGGFVRRGLAGETAFLLARFLHVSPVFWVACFYLISSGILLFAVRELALASSMNFWVLALLVSPATFSFQILHPAAGFHKEILFLAALALFVISLKRSGLSSAIVVAYITLFAIIGTLSHEATIFYLPYFFGALLLSGRTLVRALRECVVPALVALVAFYFCSTHPGNTAVAMQICSALGYKFIVPGSIDICAGGAIPYLSRSREFALADTLGVIKHYHYFRIFPAFTVLTLIPAIGESLALSKSGQGRHVKTIWIISAISFAGSIFLFVYGMDWGRWIYIHIVSITLLLLYVDGMKNPAAAELNVMAAPKRMTMGSRAFASALLLLYAGCWLLPNCHEALHFGYIERIGTAAHLWPHHKDAEPDPLTNP